MFEAGVSGPLYEGARVQTAKGLGTVYKIADEVTWTDGTPVRKSLVIVQLDDRPPSAVRSVFYADRIRLIEDDVEVEIEVHGDPED